MAEVAFLFRCSGNTSRERLTADLVVPLFIPPEKEFVLYCWAADVITEVIASKLCFGAKRGGNIVREPIVGVQLVVAAGVEKAAMKQLVFARPRIDADDGARCLAIFRAVRVAEHLELGNGIDRRIDQYGAVRTNVIVIDPVHQKQVVGVRVAVDGKIAAARESLIARVERLGDRDPRGERHQTHEVLAVQRQFANLLAFDNFTDHRGSGLDLHVGSFDGNRLTGRADIKLGIDFRDG